MDTGISINEEKIYRKVTFRLIPFLFICYVAAYLDRVNVGFAKIQMLADLKFSDTVYGLGAGIFFLGYFIFEVPSNIFMHRVGARRWIARIMVTWGVLSASMLFVSTPTSFYVIRFLLGVAEAGFFPGIILYLTYWYPAARRGHVISLFMTALPAAGFVGGPVSGLILEKMQGFYGYAGWQWLFLLEALPSIILGVVVFFYLDDSIEKSKWLQSSERDFLIRNIRNDNLSKTHTSLASGLNNPKVWGMSLIYFCFAMGLYGVGFWMPSIIRDMGVEDAFNIGMLSAIPYLFAAVGMVAIARSSDRMRERRWHIVIPAFLGGVGFILSVQLSYNYVLSIAALSMATVGILTCLALFWSLPTSMLGGAAAAAGIAFINSFGNLAGFVSPYMIGWVKDATHSTSIGMYVLAGTMMLAGLIVLGLTRRRQVMQPGRKPLESH